MRGRIAQQALNIVLDFAYLGIKRQQDSGEQRQVHGLSAQQGLEVA